MDKECLHDVVMTGKRFMHHQSSVNGIQQSLTDFPPSGPVMRSFVIFCALSLNNILINIRVAVDFRRCDTRKVTVMLLPKVDFYYFSFIVCREILTPLKRETAMLSTLSSFAALQIVVIPHFHNTAQFVINSNDSVFFFSDYVNMIRWTIHIICCSGLCWGWYLVTNLVDEQIQSERRPNWSMLLDTDWTVAMQRCALQATGSWNFVFCFYHTASRTRGRGSRCHAVACFEGICGRSSPDIFTTILSRYRYCRYSQTLSIRVHKSLHLNVTLFLLGFGEHGDSIVVTGEGDQQFGPYNEAREPFSLFIKSFMAEISYKISWNRDGNHRAFEFTYQPSAIKELVSHQLSPFEYLLAQGRWWLATYRVSVKRIYRVKLHLTRLSCHLLRKLIVFDGPGALSEISRAYKFNSKYNQVNCSNYTIMTTTFQAYIAWMSDESPDIVGSIGYENSQPRHVIDVNGEHQSKIHFMGNAAEFVDAMAWHYVYNIQCAINHRIQVNVNKVKMTGLSDSQCLFGGMAVYNVVKNESQMEGLWCKSVDELDKYHGILNLTSSENMLSIILYGYKPYFEMEVQFDVHSTECIGLFFGVVPEIASHVENIQEQPGSISARIQVPCKDCTVLQFRILPFDPTDTFVEYTMIWESSRCIKDGAALVNITEFPPHSFFGHYAFRGLFLSISDSHSEDLSQAQIIGSSLEVIITIEGDLQRRIQTVRFKNSPCSIPCQSLPLNNRVLDFFKDIGQTLCDVCNTHIISGNMYLQPTYDTCMEIRTKGTNCKVIKMNVVVMFSHYYSISITFAGNVDLYINDMYTDFQIRPSVFNTGCLTLVKFSNSITEHRHLNFSKLSVYAKSNFVSHTGSWKTWREVEYFCAAKGLEMVTVNSFEEQHELVQFAKKYMIREGVPLGIWRDVSIAFKTVDNGDSRRGKFIIQIKFPILTTYDRVVK